MSMRRLALLLMTTVACAAPAGSELERNKELARRFTAATNAADWGALAEIVSGDFVRHSAATNGPEIRSLDAFIELQQGFLQSFPDQHVTIEQLVAEGDFVALRAVYSGTQTGPMGEFPATGKRVEAPFLAVMRIESGRIAELWVEWDNLSMLGQLGLFPAPS